MLSLASVGRHEPRLRAIFHISVRRLDHHSFDHSKKVDRNSVTVNPEKLRITIPVPVQNRALKRHRDPKNVGRELDRQKMKNKSVIISAKNSSLNHRKSETYGTFEKLPLVSAGWHHRKSVGDYFTINPFLPQPATNFDSKLAKPPTFQDYQLDSKLIRALALCGFTKPTNIQHEAIPAMLEHPDCSTLIAAETGNGKTLAFLVPMLQHILRRKEMEDDDGGPTPHNSPYGVIVTPGRELADQIGGVADMLASELDIKVRVHKGGQIRKQILHGPRNEVDLVVGTQGSLDKLFHEKYLKRDRVSMIALDEIDTLLDDTFKDALVGFLKKFGQQGVSVATGVTILMAGATFPTNFDSYLAGVLDVDEVLKVTTDNIHRVLFHIPQKFIRVSPTKKPEKLLEILEKDLNKKKKILIFSNKASTSDFVQIFLKENNIPAVNFNAAHHYKFRKETLEKFSEGEVNVMSCTDLISRGIDTRNVSHVINYDFPLNPADYIHRVGRVGRVGGVHNGHVTSLVDNMGGVMVLQNIETAVRKNMEIQKVNNNIIRIIQFRAERRNRKIFT